MKKFKTLNKNTLEEGFRYLAKKETAFKRILEEKNYNIAPFSKKSGFEGLIALIVEQQLSVASAKAIFNRLKKIVTPFEPEEFLKVDDREFKEAGLSKQKIDYCNGIAEMIKKKELNLNELSKSIPLKLNNEVNINKDKTNIIIVKKYLFISSRLKLIFVNINLFIKPFLGLLKDKI